MIRKMLNRDEAITLLGCLQEDDKVKVYSDDKWAYPMDLPDQLKNAKDSIMLDVMIEIEQKAGTLIYIPKMIEDIEKSKLEKSKKRTVK